ncbi:MAG: hypothetical protein NVS9B14_07590 [Candidatus Acidiferrum sp.]
MFLKISSDARNRLSLLQHGAVAAPSNRGKINGAEALSYAKRETGARGGGVESWAAGTASEGTVAG